MPSKRRKTSTPVETSPTTPQDPPPPSPTTNESPPQPKRSRPSPPQPQDTQISHPHRRSHTIHGKPAEAGIIQKVHLENFMCHRRFTVEFCRNVNFIHGQNGSGKSAILAAIQICLGAGAKRTHRARNLKDLVRKEGDASGARVRVTLLNRGGDAFQPDVYGKTVTVERCISLRGGYNGYKLLDDNLKEQSRSKKDLDALLDQLNIQVENPVAVLDQEEAKKFLCGKAEDKYHFFVKATELERLDNSYASVVDHIYDLSESNARIKLNMRSAQENVRELKAEWDKFQALENLEDKLSGLRMLYAWSFYKECHHKHLCEQEQQQKFEHVRAKRLTEFQNAESNMNVDSTAQQQLQEQLGELTSEAQHAMTEKESLEKERKAALHPLRQRERALKHNQREFQTAQRRLNSATKELQNTRAEIVRRAGSAESEERKRIEGITRAEEEMGRENERLGRVRKDIEEYLAKYEELEPREQAAVEKSVKAGRQLYGVKKRWEEMKAGEGNSLAMFGPKCVAMHRKVEQAKREGRFTGTVVGPIGMYLKIAPGKEVLAPLAEFSLGFGVLDRFIVTNDRDRSYFMKLRNEMRCSPRDCGVYQMHEGPRYRVIPPPSDDVETVASVLNIEHDLVLNCLVDNCRTDQVALMHSKDSSERALLVEDENRSCSIRGGNIKQVCCLPKGDIWRVTRGGETAAVSNDKKLRQTIGIDRTEAIRESERDIEQLTIEVRQLKQEEKNEKDERNHYKLKWNEAQQIMNRTTKKISSLQNTIDNLTAQAEEAVNFTVETTDLEDDVRKAEEECRKLKENEEEQRKAIRDLQPDLENIQNRLEEISARNEKVVKEILTCENSLKEFMRNQTERTRVVDKKRKKLQLVEEAIAKQNEVVNSRLESEEESLYKARVLTYQNNKLKETKRRKNEGLEEMNEESLSTEQLNEELKNIQPMESDKKPEYFKNKILRAQRDLVKEREKRALAESDPLVAFEKYQRAQNDFDSKMEQIDEIENTIESLKNDVRERKALWKVFRDHIGNMTNDTFDEMLNKKGSCGQIEFDHRQKQLNLIVQKDNRDEHSQTKDVKALSGGERSFTTLSLLLALGEMLETPFRVMDEFDVFLDPMSRKIALNTMVSVAKGLEHRQFIFITPQDLSNLKTDSMLKIVHMKPPSRNAVVGGPTQQILDFE